MFPTDTVPDTDLKLGSNQSNSIQPMPIFEHPLLGDHFSYQPLLRLVQKLFALQPFYRTVKGIQADDINPHDEDDIAIIEIFEDELESVYRLLLEEKQEREKNMR